MGVVERRHASVYLVLLDGCKQKARPSAMSDNLFESLSGMQEKTIPAILQPGTRILIAAEGRSTVVPAPNTVPLRFEIQPITSNQLMVANEVLDAAVPPPLYEESARTGTMGMTKTPIGRDHDDPDYLARLAKLRPKRNAILCLHGCPALMETTPGVNVEEKAKALLSGVPAFVIIWLASELEDASFLAGVGEDKVAAFFQEGSAASGSSKSTSGRSRTKGPKQR
jgi:hypothetical protein